MPDASAPGRSAPGLLAAAGAFLLPVAYSPSVYAPFWSPKAAVLLVLGGAGLFLLPGLWRSSSGMRRPALAATAFAGLATLSTVTSPAPVNALVGLYNWGTGLVFVLCLVGCWALGARVPARDRPLVVWALLAGIAVSGAVALLQVLVSIGVPSLDLAGRAAGLAGNPVHLGTLAAGAAGILVARARSSWRCGAAVAAPATVVQLSGTRFALAVLLGLVGAGAVIAVVADRRWRLPAMLLLATGVGLGAGTVIARVGDVTTAVSRSADGATSVVAGSGYRVRLEVWGYSRGAITERPVLGHGPGRFRAATSADRTIETARLEGPDAVYTDAHNLFVEHAVTTGLVASLALLAWLVLSLRRSGGPLLWFAVAALAMAMVQPSNVQSTPLLLLTLGAARRSDPGEPRPWPVAGGALAGLVLAAVLLVGDVRLYQARLDFELAHARGANTLLRPWPEPATILARAHSFLALTGESTDAAALHWRREAVRRDPEDPALRILLGDELQAAGAVEAAGRQYRVALRHNPWSTSALSRLARLAVAQGDTAAARRHLERALLVRPDRVLERRLRALG